MRLNPDCIRDILLSVEEKCDFRNGFMFPSEIERLNKYDQEEVLYHLKQCQLSGLLHKVTFYLNGSCYVNDLSPSGHQFLADIRTDNNWTKTKTIAENVGSYSLDILKSIASGVIAGLVNKQLGI
ncbi:MAG TPA: hypothetical protein DF409_05900 [Bacteroidales bacterium]|nr:hypothetical protein [Bacteroidales bacterium]